MLIRKDGGTVRKLLLPALILGMACLLGMGIPGCKKKVRETKETKSTTEAKVTETRASRNEPEMAPDLEPGDGGKAPTEIRDKGGRTAATKDKGGRATKTKAPDEGRHGPEPAAAVGGRPRQERLANILTAGSFDDNLSPEAFQSFLRQAELNIYARHLVKHFRSLPLTVTVRGGDGRPVGEALVSIAAAPGRSVDLVTRTDGRAVFLASWDRLPADQDLAVTITPPDGSAAVHQTVPAGNTRCEVVLSGFRGRLPCNLDLGIVLDTTGSMKDELKFLKDEAEGIAREVRVRFPHVRTRYGLVVYRDENMGDEYVTRTFDFTPDLHKFRKNLAAQSAAGGGDLPEAMHRGLEEAAKLTWRDRDTARVLFLIADAPPHVQDGRATLKGVNALRRRAIAVYPVAASCPDADANGGTEFYMRTAALLTGSQYLFLTDDSGVGDAHAEPHIPFYQVQKLSKLLARMIACELSGQRIEPKRGDILRTVGQRAR
jgi:hypothetical protein